MSLLDGVSGTGDGSRTYTKVHIRNKDANETFTIDMVNARIKGNKASWTIRDGVVYDSNGKTIEDNVIEVTRYQAALIKAAAGGNGDTIIDERDLIGASYAYNATEELQKAKSEYKLVREDFNEERVQYSDWWPSADATEGGVIFAEVVKKGSEDETGRLVIDIRTDEQLAEEQRRKEEADKMFEEIRKREENPLYDLWKRITE